MPPAIFRDLGYIGLALQPGVGVSTAPTKFYKFTRSALLPDQKVQDYRNGNTRDYTFTLKESLRYAGTFEAMWYADEGSAVLAWAMGNDAITGAADPYTHTLTLTDFLPFLSGEVEYAEGQMINRLIDGKISSLTISGEATKPLFITPDFVASGAVIQLTPASVVFNDAPSEGPFTYLDGSFTLTGPTGDAATLQLQIQKFTLEINNNVESIYGPGSLTPIFALETSRNVTLKFSVYIAGDDLFRLAYYGNSNGTGPSRIVGTGSFVVRAAITGAPQARDMVITLPNINYTMARPNISPDAKPALYEVEATAIRVANVLPMSAVVHNGVSASYVVSATTQITLSAVTNPVVGAATASANGTCLAGCTVEVSVSDGVLTRGPFVATVTGTTWSVTGMVLTGLANGPILYTAVAVDSLGRVGYAALPATKS